MGPELVVDVEAVGVPEQKGTGMRILTADRARQRPERCVLCAGERVKGRVMVDDLTGLDQSVLLGLHATDPEEAARVVEERGGVAPDEHRVRYVGVVDAGGVVSDGGCP